MDVSLVPDPSRRAEMSQAISEQIGLDEAMIERLVRAFYARVRADELLGPIFNAHVADWDTHIARLCDFWSSVALMTGRYHGQPLQEHLPLPIETPHFERWLSLFEATARETCPPAAVDHLLERAHRIARSFRMGIDVHRGILPTRSRPRAPRT